MFMNLVRTPFLTSISKRMERSTESNSFLKSRSTAAVGVRYASILSIQPLPGKKPACFSFILRSGSAVRQRPKIDGSSFVKTDTISVAVLLRYIYYDRITPLGWNDLFLPDLFEQVRYA